VPEWQKPVSRRRLSAANSSYRMQASYQMQASHRAQAPLMEPCHTGRRRPTGSPRHTEPRHTEPRRTDSPCHADSPAAPRARPPVSGSRRPGPRQHIAECPGKYNCPVFTIGLPWRHDFSPGAEAARIYESGAAAFGCLGRRSGCLVSASRQLPAAAPGESPSGAVSFTSGRIDRHGKLSSRKASRTGWIIDTPIA
jgi:hypothetical protein